MNFPEVEPNDSNAASNIVSCIANNDTITGTTTGALTTAGAASLDNFRVTTCATAPGIYRNRFTTSTPVGAGSGGSLRGFSQSAGVINTTSDAAFQSGSGSGTVALPRIDQWYSFGAASDVYYRVTGVAATTAAYTATYTQTTVTPVVLVGSLNPGPITISRATGNTADTDFWVYDSSFNPVATFGIDDSTPANTMTRTFAAGTYYLAVSNANSANNLSSLVPGETFLSGNVMPFPGTWANSSTTTITNLNMSFSDGVSTLIATAAKPTAFDSAFIQFTVAVTPPANDLCANATAITGSGTLLGNTSLASNDAPVVSCDAGGAASRDVWYSFTAGATGGTLALDTCTTTAIDSVLTVFDACGGMELACNDDCGGSPCAATASCVGPLTLAPNQVVKIRVADKGLTGGAFTLNRTFVPVPANNDCANATAATGTVTVTGTTVLATNDGVASCDPGGLASRDVWYSYTAGPTGGSLLIDSCTTTAIDSVLSVYDACGGLELACNDDCGGSPCAATASCLGPVVLTPNQVVKVRVADKGLTAGAFTVHFIYTAAPPPNDDCSGAILVAIPSATAGSTAAPALAELAPFLNSTCTGPGSNESSQNLIVNSPGVWYRVNSPTARTIYADTLTAGYDTSITVFSSCASATCVTMNDDIQGSPFHSKVAWQAAAGQDYFILVHGFGATDTGSFTLNVTADATPANDDCSAATLIAGCSGSLGGTLVGATGQNSDLTSALLASCSARATFFDVWYSYTAPSTGTLTLATCGTNDTVLSVHTACPVFLNPGAAGNQLAPTSSSCNDNGPVGCTPGSQVAVAVTAGTNYLIRVATAGAASINAGGGQPFTLTWSIPDTTPPSIVCPGTGPTVAADALCAALIPDVTGLVTASDNCGTVTLTQSPVAGTSVGLGVTPVTVTATDGALLTNSCVINVTVADLTGPTLSCGPDAAPVNADALCQAIVPDFTAGATASDSCSPPVTLSQSPLAGSTVTGAGVHNITVTAMDAAGNISTCINTMTLVDVTAPIVTAGSIASCYPSVSAAEAAAILATTVVDACGAPMTAATVGTCSAVITVTATDAGGNSASVMYNTTIDGTPPTITCPPNQTVASGVPVAVVIPAPTVADNCPGTVTFTNSFNGTSDASDTYPVGTTTVVWTATDACGNTATCNQTITVGLAAMKISQVYGAGGNVSGTVLADYIELYNAGVVPQVLTGWSIQFASTAGTAWTTSNFLAGATVNPGQYFLVRCALSAATGQAPNLPTPDHTTTFALSATDAKIALCNTTTALTGATPTSATIVDFIGFGTASQREPLVGGTTANNAVRPDASVATFRLNGGAQDTNNNFADFAQGYPAPRNTATALNNGLSPMGAALPTYGEEGNTIRLHATVMNNATSSAVLGATVTVNLTSLGGGAAVAMNDSGLGADQVGGDGIYSATVVIPAGAAVGTRTLPVTATLAGLSGGNYISLEVRPTTTPDNDNCQTATALTGAFPITVVADVQGATIDTNPTRLAGTETPSFAWGAQGADRGVWYTVVGTGNSMTAETCGGVAGDTVVQVFGGTCEGLTVVASSDDFGAGCTAGTSNSRAIWCSSVGQLYYVSVAYFGSAMTSVPSLTNPTLTITDSGVSCATALPVPVCSPNLAATDVTDSEAGFGLATNDGCTTAANLFQNVAAPTGTPLTFKGTARSWSANKDLDWYRFQAATSGSLSVTVNAQFMSLVQIVQLSPTGTCSPAPTVVAQSAVGLRCAPVTVIGGVTAGNWYAVVVLPLSIVLPTSANYFGGTSPDAFSYNYFGSMVLIAPPNDTCANASIVAVPSTTNGSTILATTDGTSSCDATGRDVWYTFTLASPTTVEIDASSTGIDTVVSLQASCAGPEIACNDDGTCFVSGTNSSVGPINLAAGTYFVRVSDKNTGAGGGNFTLRIVTAVNDNCCGAIAVSIPSVTPGTTVGATTETGLPSACFGPGFQDNGGNFTVTSAGVWYTVISPTTQTVYADTLVANYDTKISVYSGSCGALSCVTINDDVVGTPDFHSKVAWVAQAGQPYFILVHGFGTGTGTFSLNVTASPTPANDECGAATLITGATGSLGGTLDGATGTPSELSSTLLSSCAGAYTLWDVWYSWTAPCAGNVTFGTCGTWDTLVSVHSACPVFLNPGATGNQIAGACNDNGVSVGCAPGSEVTLAVTAGQSVLIRVATAGSTALGNPTSLPGGGQPFTLTWSLPLTDTDGDMTPDCADGCPLNPALTAPAIFFADLDLDGFGAGPGVLSCGGAGFVLNNTDCDDTNMAVNPGATEVCNGVDDDCDTFIDEGVQLTFYADADGDSFGNPASSTLACTAPPGYVTDNTDCNDANMNVNPGATEVCNGIDDDCDTFIDEGVQLTFYADGDGDGFGAGAPTLACTAPPGFVSNNTDCNDGNAAINPGASEVCDGVDNNCNGSTDEGFDLDGDGIANCFDNCPSIANPTQADMDMDLVGDACDNCPSVTNVGQADCDMDNIGDACEGEPDCNMNSIPDSCDISSAFSMDLNVNGVPDECETFVQYCFGDGPTNGGPDCPCSNNVAIGVKRGCVNSTGNGGGLAATGVASLSSDSVTLAGTTMAPASFSLFLQSPAFAGGGLGQLSFFDGLRCIGPSFIRLTTKQSVGGAASIGFPTTPVSVLGAIGAPGLQYYQVVYRNNAGFCNFLANSTNGVSILWVP